MSGCQRAQHAHLAAERTATDLARLTCRMELLAAALGIDLDTLEARDELDRLGEYVTDWATLKRAGIDPRTGEVAG